MKALLKFICLFALLNVVTPVFAETLSGVVTLTATADDNIGVVGVQFQLDGTNLGSEVFSYPFTLFWNSAVVPDGVHTISVAARDAAGNQQFSSMTLTLDNSPPTVSVTSPGNGAQVSGSAVTVSANANDTVGVASVQFQIDGSNLTSVGGHVNVAAAANGASVSASTYCANCNNDGISYPPGAAINGDRKGIGWTTGSGGWNDSTSNSFPDWLQVDFAGPKTIGEVDVFSLQDNYASPIEPFQGLTFTQYGITSFQVQYWDGNAWATVPGGNVTGNNQVWRQISFAQVTTPRIRVLVNGSPDSWSRIIEVEAYTDSNTGVVTTSPYTVTWDSTTVSNGQHLLTAIATDISGNQTTSPATAITVNNGGGGGGGGTPGLFNKSNPSNAAASQSANLALAWGSSSNATSFEYCVDTSNNSICDTGWVSTTNNGAVLSGLNSGTTYWWQVRARNNVGVTEADNGVWWSLVTSVAGRVNVAAAANGAAATASSAVNGGYAPAGAINGDRRGTSWGNGGGWNDSSGNVFPDWLQIDFAGTQTISEVDVFTVQDNYAAPVEPFLGMTFTQYGITSFQVQYWDGSNWSTVPGGNISGNNQVWRQITFAPVSTPRIRIFVNGALNGYSRITEVEAYGDSGSSVVAPGPLAKSSPANGAASQSVNPTLGWGTSSGATSYEYCVDSTNNNICDGNWTATSGTSAVPGGLNSGTTYFWQVRARNSAGTTDADVGAWWSFTTSFGGRVNVAASANGATASASSTVNALYGPEGAINGDRRGSGWGNGGGWNDASGSVFPDWLQVDFPSSQTISEVDVFTVQDAFNSPVEPFPGQTFSLYGITSFQVQYWNGLTWGIVPGGDIAGNNQVWRQFTFSPITTAKIRVLVTGSLNAYSRITEVEAYSDVSTAPGPFTKITPSNTANGQSLTVTLNWGASSGTSSYEYCVDTFNNNSCDTGWTSTTNTSTELNASSDTTYYWQVRARNGNATTDADGATWWSFSTGSAIVTSGPNVAAAANGATATSSSFFNGAFDPTGTINGDRKGLGWGSGGGWNDATPNAYPDVLQIGFSGWKVISEIDVFTLQDNYANPNDPTPSMTFSQYGITDFQVQFWDGNNWVNLPNGTITGNNLVWRRITFTPIGTPSIRIIVNGALNGYSRIVEVEAH